jgi:hypothetical protein
MPIWLSHYAADGVVVGRIFLLTAAAPQDRPWMWASGHNGDIERAAYGWEPTREEAMQAFAQGWRRRVGAIDSPLKEARSRRTA